MSCVSLPLPRVSFPLAHFSRLKRNPSLHFYLIALSSHQIVTLSAFFFPDRLRRLSKRCAIDLSASFFNLPVHALIFNSYQYGEMPRDQPHIRLMTISRYPAETTYSITVITSSSLPRVGDRTSLWDTLRLVSHTLLRRT